MKHVQVQRKSASIYSRLLAQLAMSVTTNVRPGGHELWPHRWQNKNCHALTFHKNLSSAAFHGAERG